MEGFTVLPYPNEKEGDLKMILKSVKDLSELTLGEAEELKKAGAVLLMTPEGKIVIDTGKPELTLAKEQTEGGRSVERDAGHGR